MILGRRVLKITFRLCMRVSSRRVFTITILTSMHSQFFLITIHSPCIHAILGRRVLKITFGQCMSVPSTITILPSCMRVSSRRVLKITFRRMTLRQRVSRIITLSSCEDHHPSINDRESQISDFFLTPQPSPQMRSWFKPKKYPSK